MLNSPEPKAVGVLFKSEPPLKDECKSMIQCSFEVSFDSTRQSSASCPSSVNPTSWAMETPIDLQEEEARTVMENPAKFSYSKTAHLRTLMLDLLGCFSPINISGVIPRKQEL